ncbi:hypothetical protein RJ641_034833 [Dillenia turbinata]|uniref:Uncharacterized protein n=1 Tax=Dillenia turbinata TaxID=194707 RepID=A0AAN8VV47_9MAGN
MKTYFTLPMEIKKRDERGNSAWQHQQRGGGPYGNGLFPNHKCAYTHPSPNSNPRALSLSLSPLFSTDAPSRRGRRERQRNSRVGDVVGRASWEKVKQSSEIRGAGSGRCQFLRQHVFRQIHGLFSISIHRSSPLTSLLLKLVHISSFQPSSAQNWLGSQGSSSGLIVKRTIRIDIPVEKFPNPFLHPLPIILPVVARYAPFLSCLTKGDWLPPLISVFLLNAVDFCLLPPCLNELSGSFLLAK